MVHSGMVVAAHTRSLRPHVRSTPLMAVPSPRAAALAPLAAWLLAGGVQMDGSRGVVAMPKMRENCQ